MVMKKNYLHFLNQRLVPIGIIGFFIAILLIFDKNYPEYIKTYPITMTLLTRVSTALFVACLLDTYRKYKSYNTPQEQEPEVDEAYEQELIDRYGK